MKKISISLLLLLSMFMGYAQNNKPALSIEDVLKWNRITESIISPDGEYIALKLEPWRGSATIKLYNSKGNELFSSDSSSSVNFSFDSKYLYFDKGSGKEKEFTLYNIKEGTTKRENGFRSYSIQPKWDGKIIVAYSDSTVKLLAPDFSLIKDLGKSLSYRNSPEAQVILSTFDKYIIRYDHKSDKIDTLYKGQKRIERLSLSEDGKNVAFVSDGLLYYTDGDNIKQIADKISDKRDPQFSADGSKLYYHIIRHDRQRDTTIAKEDFPKVEVWHWREEVQFTQQTYNKKRDLEATWLGVYDIDRDTKRQLNNEPFDATIVQLDKGNSDLYIANWNKPYRVESMWEGRSRNDLYFITAESNEPQLIIEGMTGAARVSPEMKYLYWYNNPDSCWFTLPLDTRGAEPIRVTDPKTLFAFNEDNDVPDYPSSYQLAGWTIDDKYILVYDKFDIWQVDPLGKERPIRLTKDGRETKTTYRLLDFATNEQRGKIDLKEEYLFTGFDHKTKGSSIYKSKLNRVQSPTLLYGGEFSIANIRKASKADRYIFTAESFEQFPNILYSDSKFKNPLQISDANPQQKDFNWGTAELISWVSADGIKLEGVVYKPENFDPDKKYPMIVNFYETNSSSLFSHRIPEAHRSTIDYHMYTSNGYIVFNPDIVYRTGYPGESAFNAIMPGISHILEFGYVDPQRIGAQGHSWGGYQVAYLATRTSLFAAIESGAPVVNMYSAYGGIRWGSGLNRSFQYEHQQSRIGATPWEQPLRYIENSPIFTMDKVTTPILIMHNDQDGHVPWYQGIEYFTALKRLEKPVWLLNYTGEVHWPQQLKNKVDFQKRMMQFFDHYLKGKPMPKWMDQGVTAIDLDYETGY